MTSSSSANSSYNLNLKMVLTILIREQDSMSTLIRKLTESSFSVVHGNEELAGSGSSIAV